MKDRSTGIALAFGAACISGFSVFLNSFAVKEFGDATLYTTAKNLVAAVLLVGIVALLARRGAASFTMPRNARERIGLLVVGVVGGGIPFYLFFQGLAVTTSTSAAFIQKTLVIWVAVLAVSFLRERFGLLHAAAIGLLVAGQAAASGGVGGFALDRGEALVFIATLLWSVEVVVAKPLLRSLSPFTVAAARMGIGIVVLLGIALATGAFASLASITAGQWVWALVTGVVLTAYVTTWFSALSRAQAVDVTAVLVFGAVITAIISAGYRGTSLAPSAAGLALITLGTLLVTALALRRRSVTA